MYLPACVWLQSSQPTWAECLSDFLGGNLPTLRRWFSVLLSVCMAPGTHLAIQCPCLTFWQQIPLCFLVLSPVFFWDQKKTEETEVWIIRSSDLWLPGLPVGESSPLHVSYPRDTMAQPNNCSEINLDFPGVCLQSLGLCPCPSLEGSFSSPQWAWGISTTWFRLQAEGSIGEGPGRAQLGESGVENGRFLVSAPDFKEWDCSNL